MHQALRTMHLPQSIKSSAYTRYQAPCISDQASSCKPPLPICITYTLCTLLFALCKLLIHDAMCCALRYSKSSEKVHVIKIKKAFFLRFVPQVLSIFKCLCSGPISPCVIEFSLHILFLCASMDNIKLHCLTMIYSHIYAVQC